MTPSKTCEVQASIWSCELVRWRKSSQLGQPSSRKRWGRSSRLALCLSGGNGLGGGWMGGTRKSGAGGGRTYAVGLDYGADHAGAEVALLRGGDEGSARHVVGAAVGLGGVVG